jgi:hypothetical protein
MRICSIVTAVLPYKYSASLHNSTVLIHAQFTNYSIHYRHKFFVQIKSLQILYRPYTSVVQAQTIITDTDTTTNIL